MNGSRTLLPFQTKSPLPGCGMCHSPADLLWPNPHRIWFRLEPDPDVHALQPLSGFLVVRMSGTVDVQGSTCMWPSNITYCQRGRRTTMRYHATSPLQGKAPTLPRDQFGHFERLLLILPLRTVFINKNLD